MNIPSNVMMNQRPPLTMHCPHPETELLRFTLTNEARQSLGNSLQTREGLLLFGGGDGGGLAAVAILLMLVFLSFCLFCISSWLPHQKQLFD